MAGGLQGPLSGVLGKSVGVMGSVFIVHLGGALAALFFLWGPGLSKIGQWRDAPWYALGAGALGLVLIGALTVCVPRLGVAATVTLIVLGQLTVGVTFDHFGLLVDSPHHLDVSRIAGLGLVLVGTWFVVH